MSKADVARINVIADDLHNNKLWAMYEGAFEALNKRTVQRHLMHRDEFTALLNDARVIKYVRYQDKEIVGLSAYTNHLDAVPLISPPYFEEKFPQQYADMSIWYVVFVAVVAGSPFQVFGDLIRAMHQTSGLDAMTVLDVCTEMRRLRRLPNRVQSLLDHHTGKTTRLSRLDEQSYWLYDWPTK